MRIVGDYAAGCWTDARPKRGLCVNFGHRSRCLRRAALEQIKVAAWRGFQCEIEPREKGHWMNCQAWQRQREQRFQPVKMKRIVASAKSRSETMELVNRIALGTQPAKIGSIFRQFFFLKKKFIRLTWWTSKYANVFLIKLSNNLFEIKLILLFMTL